MEGWHVEESSLNSFSYQNPTFDLFVGGGLHFKGGFSN